MRPCRGNRAGVFVFAVLAPLSALPALRAASVSAARFEQDAQGLVQIRYRLDNPENREVDVSVKLSQDGGRTYTIFPQAVAGDLGTVSGSGEKLVVWDMEKDRPELLGDNFVFMVEAEPRLTGAEATGIQWVLIPGGSFMMGSEAGSSDEKPVHRVRVPSFYMAKTEVTNKQYRACVQARACTAPNSYEGGDENPVVYVDWNQASAFSKWAGGRLPSEAEWEYAARSAGQDWAYPWGNEAATCARAVINDGGYGCGRSSTWPVCSKSAGNTRQGLCDMAGNVWEWTQDWYHGSYNGAPNDARAWESPAGSYRVNRGGSWSNDAGHARSASRDGVGPGDRGGILGLRPAR